MARQDLPASCPCGSNRRYPDCCGRFHAGPQRLLAPDAEALMRSRYSAYVLGLTDYLLQTWHPSTRPNGLPADPVGLKWLALSVRRHERLDDTHARVSFVARSRLDGRGQRMEETSRFVREGGRWYYVDACE
ncbi:MAG: YchJ family metal-binding protein [Burkholderiaceae bacterium]